MADAVVAESKPVSSGSNDKMTRGLILWLLAPIGSLFFMNETDAFLKFYGKQALYYGIFTVLVYIIVMPLLTAVTLGFAACIFPIVGLADLGLRIFMIVKVKNGEKVKLPVIGDMSEKA